MTLTNLDDAILATMEAHGGSFVQSLAACCRRADAVNLAKLKAAFPELFGEYAELAGMLARRRDAAAG